MTPNKREAPDQDSSALSDISPKKPKAATARMVQRPTWAPLSYVPANGTVLPYHPPPPPPPPPPPAIQQQLVADAETFLYFVNSVNNFYSSNTTTALPPSTSIQHQLNRLFDSYRDSPETEPDKILINGAQAYLSDLSIAVDEVVHFALCQLLDVGSIGEFERKAFVSGWFNASTTAMTEAATAARSSSSSSSSSSARSTQTIQHPQPLDTIPRQSAFVSLLRSRLTSDPAYFKTIYRAAFKFAKPEHQRSVPLESALEFWKMFFSTASGGIEWNKGSNGLQWLDLWLEFYETQGKRPVNKDLWNMVGELVLKTTEAPDEQTLQGWRTDAAWPFAIDDFIAWVKEKEKVGDLSSAEAGQDKMDTS